MGSGRSLSVLLFVWFLAFPCPFWGADSDRVIRSIAVTPDGSILTSAIADFPHHDLVIASLTESGKALWQMKPANTPTTLTFFPDRNILAVGFKGVGGEDPGVLLLEAKSGTQTEALGFDKRLMFTPGESYPSWGDGVSQLAFSLDGGILYGLSDDTSFAWDTSAQKYLWTRDVPADFVNPPDVSHPLPYGHATTFALSTDGRQIAAARGSLRVATAGRIRPPHFIKRATTGGMDPPARPTFSADSRILAAGEFNAFHPGPGAYRMSFWSAGSLKAQEIPGCGGGIAWTDDPNVFGCQNETGAHLRDLREPMKDLGAAGPVSDLPILKVGNSLWAAAYRRTDWKDPTKALSLTLVELGTGKRVMVSLPGR